jgi:glycosyltransferase involved in cell wall biosynthesis
MKILFYINGLFKGGKERQLIELLTGLHKQAEVQFELVLMDKSIHYEIPNHIKVHYIIRKSKKDFGVFKKLSQICKEFKPDIIHTWDTMTSFYALPICLKQKIKLINGSIRNARPNKGFKGNSLNSLLFKYSDVVVANSLAGLYAYGINARKGVCIYNGFNENRLVEIKPDTKSKIGITQPYIVGMVGSFEIRKDFKSFIETALLLAEKRNDIAFITIGGGKLLEECKKMVPKKYQNQIKFTGVHQNVESLVNIFDIGVLLTNGKVHGEGISNSIMEYMILGKPVIATDNGGNKELIEDKKSGVLIKDNDIQSVADTITYLIDHPSVSKKYGHQAKEIILNKFNFNKMVQSYISLYKKVLSN